jgi:hypothetical protein
VVWVGARAASAEVSTGSVAASKARIGFRSPGVYGIIIIIIIIMRIIIIFYIHFE